DKASRRKRGKMHLPRQRILGLDLPEQQEGLSHQANPRVGIVGSLSPVYSGEVGLETVVVLLRDGVELVVVTAGAVDRHAHKRGHDGRDHVVAVDVMADLTVDALGADVAQRAFVPGAGREHPKRHHAARFAGKEDVGGHLLLYESGEGTVLVE